MRSYLIFFPAHKIKKRTEINTIAFGSCVEQWKQQPVLEEALTKNPDIFIYLGDNIYSDTYNMDTLRKIITYCRVNPNIKS